MWQRAQRPVFDEVAAELRVYMEQGRIVIKDDRDGVVFSTLLKLLDLAFVWPYIPERWPGDLAGDEPPQVDVCLELEVGDVEE